MCIILFKMSKIQFFESNSQHITILPIHKVDCSRYQYNDRFIINLLNLKKWVGLLRNMQINPKNYTFAACFTDGRKRENSIKFIVKKKI